MKKQKSEYVEYDFDLDELRKKCGPYILNKLWSDFRYSKDYNLMSFQDWFSKMVENAVEVKIWIDSPKIITAGTDGSIRVELV